MPVQAMSSLQCGSLAGSMEGEDSEDSVELNVPALRMRPSKAIM